MSAVSREIKLVLVGDDVSERRNNPGSGNSKTILLYTYIYQEYPKKHIPNHFHNHKVDSSISQDTVALYLWDTKCENLNPRLRDLSYENTDIFLIVFSVVDRPSYNNVRKKWVPELGLYCPNVPFLLVGCHTEDREILERQGFNPITTHEGKQLAKEINAVNYVECSAYTGENVKQVFENAVQAVLDPSPFFKFPTITEQIFTFFAGEDTTKKKIQPSIGRLIEELREYAQKRKAEGEGFRWPWGDLMGGKPGAVKIQAARALADELELNTIALKKKFPPDQVEALLDDDLGIIVRARPDVVSYLQGNCQLEPMAESEDTDYSAEGGLSY